MLKTVTKAELNQISLTGFRSIALIGLLIIAPRSLKEIRKIFLKLNVIDEKNSDDMIRVDISTIKAFGCEILRPCAQTNHKYILTKHPFNIPITIEQINIIKRIYNKIKKTSNIKKLIEYDDLFKKISSFIFDEELKEAFAGISALRYYDTELIKKLNSCCKNRYDVTISYHTPSRKEESIKNISTIKLIYKNDKVYLYGYDTDKERLVTLNLNRIKALISKCKKQGNVIPNGYSIKYKLLDYKNGMLENNERITEKQNDYVIVQGTYYNDFYAIQRVLSLKEKCVVLEPENFKEIIVEKLKEMSKIYE